MAVPTDDDSPTPGAQKWFSFFTISTDSVIYQSEVTRCYKSACWRTVNLSCRALRTQTRGNRIAVQVWIKPITAADGFDVDPVEPKPASTDGYTLLRRYVVDLFGLTLLKQAPENTDVPHSESNALLIALGTCWYLASPLPPDAVRERLPPKYLRAQAVSIRRMYTETSLSRLISLCTSLEQDTRWDRLKGEDVWRSEHRARLERTRARVSFLKLKLAAQRTRTDQERARVDKQREQLLEKQRVMERRYADLDERIAALNDRKDTFADTEHKLKEVLLARDMRQAVLVLELYSVYHVKPITEDLCSIMGIELPNGTFTDRDDDAIATALGYVSHLVLMISKYLQLPLRYPIKLLGSRSSITDDIAFDRSDRPRRFPLYPRVKDRSMFERGVFLLNKDVQQLLEHHGIGVRDALATLPNIRRLMLLLYDFTKQHNPDHGTPA
ncbi:hypothetical protein PTSG_11573 [Salpingoeca rosetta]|uniref:UV radiation resistance-associated gene protein n=1 Tax=Salpingoeca rosetta (strain ATCC 50818 / BSB-021) TaxID=946362 RepID=F2TW31_SALR5|nr:uncharacterized protein PTSG_11573 [Salpingoeca rosetta]EGD72277.1 hypothetical protein PTSG_11573 [Salpingoeca rosetta]|eukprot:XP_004998847.1 hypothetical protein PTSG_11573 [Salpingoeca rosetta]